LFVSFGPPQFSRMGERKVINKYYPPDFDPALVPKRKRPKNEQVKVRMMMPMSVRCTTCGEYIYRGKKFNSRKETVLNEDYLGIKIFRFYIRCTRCSSEITIKTDPKNSDYVVEMGATRNFEQWKENQKIVEEFKRKRQEEEEGNAMKILENKTIDSKMEMDILDALDEIRALNAKHERISPEDLLKKIIVAEEIEQEEELSGEDARELEEFMKQKNQSVVKRLDDEIDAEHVTKKPKFLPALPSVNAHLLSFGDDKEATLESMSTPIPSSQPPMDSTASLSPIQQSHSPSQSQSQAQLQSQHAQQTTIKNEPKSEETETIKAESSEKTLLDLIVPQPQAKKKNPNQLKLNIQPKLKTFQRESTTTVTTNNTVVSSVTSGQIQQQSSDSKQQQSQPSSDSKQQQSQQSQQNEEDSFPNNVFRLVDYDSDKE
jgi:DNA-directed RNA polymerase subunit RPC12/RpoP